MPTVGPFHRKYWGAKANTPPPLGTGERVWMYPMWQSTVTLAIWGPPVDLVTHLWQRLCWWGRLIRRVYVLTPAQRDGLLSALALLETGRLFLRHPLDQRLTPEQWVSLDRVMDALNSPLWEDACARVRACATSPKFHQPEQWLEYSRALKANPGQAQNVFRHVRVVHELRAAHDVSNPQAHLLTELAYQAMSAAPRPSVIINHPVLDTVVV